MIQGSGFCQFMNEEENENSFFFRINGEEERKLHSPIITGFKTGEQLPHIMNKKGRPKGQKTSQSKPRKRRDSESDGKDSNMKFGHWCLQENKKYHWFLELYNSHFMNRHMRRMDKIFKTMAIFIGTRQAEQCRSHHQKMEKKYNSFCRILLSLRKQHYGTQEPSPVEADISDQGLIAERALISAQALQDEETDNTESPVLQTELNFEEQPVESQFLENPIQIDLIANLFNDEKYQNNLGLHDFF